MSIPSLQSSFDQYNICVVLPTYNNAGTLLHIIKELLSYTHNIIVVNDGSTDDTANILSKLQNIEIVSYTPNQGKGLALQRGFQYAEAKGYDYAITLDSDGQHYPKDLLTFIQSMQEHAGALMIGARNMDQAHIPGKSTFGNKFSNFWFWVETGIQLPDTQSGYRLYPLRVINNKRYFSSKYEFEIEAPVRAAWSGTPVIAVPVSVYYPPASERVSHFRPLKDFTRISILNTFLTFIALFWIHPRNFFLKISNKQGLKTLWRNSFVKPAESNIRKASSIGFGIFMGIVPIWGFQLAIGIPLAILFKLNKPLFILAANISIFPFTPFIWAFSIMTGKWLLGYQDWGYDIHSITSLAQIKESGLAFFLGGTVLAIASALIFFLASWIGFAITRSHRFK